MSDITALIQNSVMDIAAEHKKHVVLVLTPDNFTKVNTLIPPHLQRLYEKMSLRTWAASCVCDVVLVDLRKTHGVVYVMKHRLAVSKETWKAPYRNIKALDAVVVRIVPKDNRVEVCALEEVFHPDDDDAPPVLQVSGG